MRGLALNRDDILRRAVIMAIMCQGELDFGAMGDAHLVDFRSYFARELERLGEMVAMGLVRLSDSSLEVTEQGWYFVRAIAMTFDKYLQSDQDRARFSKII